MALFNQMRIIGLPYCTRPNLNIKVTGVSGQLEGLNQASQWNSSFTWHQAILIRSGKPLTVAQLNNSRQFCNLRNPFDESRFVKQLKRIECQADVWMTDFIDHLQ